MSTTVSAQKRLPLHKLSDAKTILQQSFVFACDSIKNEDFVYFAEILMSKIRTLVSSHKLKENLRKNNKGGRKLYQIIRILHSVAEGMNSTNGIAFFVINAYRAIDRSNDHQEINRAIKDSDFDAKKLAEKLENFHIVRSSYSSFLLSFL